MDVNSVVGVGSFGRGGKREVFRGVYTHKLSIVQSVNKLDRNRVVFWQGEPQGRQIEVVEGVVRAVHLSPGGERQVLAFFWPGDVILPVAGNAQPYTAETVTDCTFRLSKPEPETAGASEQVLHEVLELLRGVSRRSALSRIAWFLLRSRDHLPPISGGQGVFKFLIPRGDIADHIGLSLETVSRGLTELRAKNVIDMPNRNAIRFKDVAQLAMIAQS